MSQRPAEDAGFEPARRSRADHRFRDGCLARLGQSSIVDIQLSVEAPGVEPGPTPYQGVTQTAMLHLVHLRGGRADRTRAGLSPGPRVSNPVPSPLGQPSTCPLNSARQLGRRLGRSTRPFPRAPGLAAQLAPSHLPPPISLPPFSSRSSMSPFRVPLAGVEPARPFPDTRF